VESCLKQLIGTLIAWGPAGVFLLAILDSTGVPLVGGVDALVVVVAAANHGAAWMAAGAAVIGSMLGSFALFYLARKGGEAYLARYTSEGRGARFKAWFERYGLVTVFIPAASPIPMPMKVFVLSAGAMEISPVSFGAVLLVARIPRYFLIAWLGTRLGAQTLPFLSAYTKEHAVAIVLVALVLCVLVIVANRFVERKRAPRPA
jgi:membrane protein YqaA with SNARE-associated domain